MDKYSKALELNYKAVDLQSQGRLVESLNAFKEALTLFQELNDIHSEAICLNGVGALYKDLGENNKSEFYLEEALVKRRLTHNTDGEARTLMTLGPVYQYLGKSEKALSSLKGALSIAGQLNDLNLIGQTKFNFGDVFFNMGELGRAIESYEEALQIQSQINNVIEVNKCLNLLAILCQKLGLYEQSIKYSNYVLNYAKANGNTNSESCALSIIGENRWILGQKNEAVKYIEDSINLDIKEKRLTQAAVSMSGLVFHYCEVKRLKEAFLMANKCLEIAKSGSNLFLLIKALESLGICHFFDENYIEAREKLIEALNISNSYKSPISKSAILYHLGLVYKETGKIDDAIESFQSCIALNEEMRENILNEDYRVSFFDTRNTITVYYVLSSLLVKASVINPSNTLKFINEAFNVNEKRRSKMVQDYFNVSHLEYEEDFSIKKIQDKLLDKDTVLLEYSLHKTFCFLWVITDDRSTVLTIEIDEILSRINSLRSILRNRRAINEDYKLYLENAFFLYNLLIKPAEEFIAEKQNLIIVPDLYLHLIPFQLLLTEPIKNLNKPSKNTRFFNVKNNFRELPYLIKKYNISYAPSASILLSLNGKSLSNKLEGYIAFAPIEYSQVNTNLKFENLPGTKEEVISISKLFEKDKVSVKLKKEAKKEYLLNDNSYQYVHIASHSFISALENGSVILFYGNEIAQAWLSPKEIVKSNISAELVVLSACSTAIGKLSPSEGIIGLIRAFFIAGTESVCASLWNVDDKSTSELMIKFYNNMLNKKQKKPEALRNAQLSLINGEKWSSPFYWAPFILEGGRYDT